MKLISHCLTAMHLLSGIQSLIDLGNLIGPAIIQCFTSGNTLHFSVNEASPKAISGRTSYIRVRLEFLRYPQVIRHHCNGGRFGPPWSFTSTSACSWIGHPVSGLWQRTSRPIQTRSRFGFGTEYLNLARYYNSPDRSTKSTSSHLNVL